MKFKSNTGPGSQDRGLTFHLINEAGEYVGILTSTFISNYHPFCANSAPARLTAKAVVFDMRTGKQEVVAEMPYGEYRRRKEADQAFRQWAREHRIRERMVDAARRLKAAIAHEARGSQSVQSTEVVGLSPS